MGSFGMKQVSQDIFGDDKKRIQFPPTKPTQDKGTSIFFYRADISMADSKKQTINLTKMLEVRWSMPEVLLIRACHTYTLLAPYAKGMPKIVFLEEEKNKKSFRGLVKHQTFFFFLKASLSRNYVNIFIRKACHLNPCVCSLW